MRVLLDLNRLTQEQRWALGELSSATTELAALDHQRKLVQDKIDKANEKLVSLQTEN